MSSISRSANMVDLSSAQAIKVPLQLLSNGGNIVWLPKMFARRWIIVMFYSFCQPGRSVSTPFFMDRNMLWIWGIWWIRHQIAWKMYQGVHALMKFSIGSAHMLWFSPSSVWRAIFLALCTWLAVESIMPPDASGSARRQHCSAQDPDKWWLMRSAG